MSISPQAQRRGMRLFDEHLFLLKPVQEYPSCIQNLHHHSPRTSPRYETAPWEKNPGSRTWTQPDQFHGASSLRLPLQHVDRYCSTDSVTKMVYPISHTPTNARTKTTGTQQITELDMSHCHWKDTHRFVSFTVLGSTNDNRRRLPQRRGKHKSS